MNNQPGRGVSLFMGMLSIIAMTYTIRYIAQAIATGSVPGKLGAIYYAPDFHFYAFIGLAALGTLLGITLLIMSAIWLFRR